VAFLDVLGKLSDCLRLAPKGKIAAVEQLPDIATISELIIVLRGQRVMLDAVLARLYGVSTSRLMSRRGAIKHASQAISYSVFRPPNGAPRTCRNLRQVPSGIATRPGCQRPSPDMAA
jgi:hypothetical protein